MLSKIVAVSILSCFVVKSETLYSDIGVLEIRNDILDDNSTLTPPPLNPAGINVTIQQMLLDKHNYYRSLVASGNTPGYPAATNIESLVWDPALASVAQTYAEKCIWTHNADRKTQFYQRGDHSMWYDSSDIGVGENLYAFGPGSYDPNSIIWGVGAWYNEYPNWSYGTSGTYPSPCATGQVCGHFTQLIWGNSRYVGCGVNYCANGLVGWTTDPVSIVVCDYYPVGNYGGRTIYEKASDATKVASNCNGRSGDAAVSGLCDGCYSSYGTQCNWNQWSTCTDDVCADVDNCYHCHAYCLNKNNSVCSNTCLNQVNLHDQCTDNLGRSLGKSPISLTTATTTSTTTTTTTKSPTTTTTTTTTTKSPTTTTTTTKSPTTTTSNPTTTTKSPTNPPTTSTTTKSPTSSTTQAAASGNTGNKCCAKDSSNNVDVTYCNGFSNTLPRCSITRRCQIC